jgi:transposase
VDLLIKKVKRVGHGFRNFANYRLRLLLHCGVRWQTHRTARLRSRSHAWWRSTPRA